MKWSRRFRARLRRALRAAQNSWHYETLLPNQRVLTVLVTVSDEDLASGNPNVPVSVANSAWDRAYDATRKRMNFA